MKSDEFFKKFGFATKFEPKEYIKQWSKTHSDIDENIFIKKLREGGLGDDQIIIVIDAINVTCNKCWNNWPTTNHGCEDVK